MLSLVTFVLFALVPLVFAQVNGFTFVFCSGGGYLPNTGDGNPNAGYASSVQPSGEACATYCRSQKATAGITDNIYAQFQPAQYAASDNCVCLSGSQGPAAGNTNAGGAGGNQDCGAAFGLYRESTFNFDQCYSGFTGASQSTLVTADLSQCFDQCRGSLNLIINVPGNFNGGDGQYHCTCASSSVTYGVPGPCDAGNSVQTTTQVFRYTHPPDAAASMLSRRSRRMVNQVPQFCPAGLTACSIASDSDSYECLDTSYELESCGGCLYGEYTGLGSAVKLSGNKNSKGKGVNCYDLGGFGMTCHRGQCIKL